MKIIVNIFSLLFYAIFLFGICITGNYLIVIVDILSAIIISKKINLQVFFILIIIVICTISIMKFGSSDRNMTYFEKKYITSYLEKNTNTKEMKVLDSNLKIRTASGWNELFKIYLFDYEYYQVTLETSDNIKFEIRGKCQSNKFEGLEAISEQYKMIKNINPNIAKKYKNIKYKIYAYNQIPTIYINNNINQTIEGAGKIWYDLLKNVKHYGGGGGLDIFIVYNDKSFYLKNGNFCLIESKIEYNTCIALNNSLELE